MLLGFSWIEQPYLAGLSYPQQREDLLWLRSQGIEILLTLTPQSPPRDWVNEAGLMLVHVPIEDMSAPTQTQLDYCVDTIQKARQANMGVAVHCLAGIGRTGTILASYLVTKGYSADDAILKIRRERPGSIETHEQEMSVSEFAKRYHAR